MPRLGVPVQVLKRLPNYLAGFGLLPGLRLFLSVALHQASGDSQRRRSLRVPGHRQTIVLRDTTADHATFWQCLVMNQYDFFRFAQARQIEAAYRAMLSRDKTPLIIDCGANIGLASVWLAQRFPQADIYAVEPDDHNFEILCANTAHLGDRIHCLKGGIWNASRKLHITNPEAGSAAFRVEELPLDAAQGIRGYTIDEICALAGNDSPLYVKLDIEGAQAKLFESGTDWVGRTGLISLELDDWLFPGKNTSQNFFGCLSQYSFDYLLGDESIFCFRNPHS